MHRRHLPRAVAQAIDLDRADERVDDPKTWLREQLKIDVSGFEDAVTRIVRSPDSPFAGSALDEQLRNWRALIDSLSGLPLEGCDEPQPSPSDHGWEMACEWPLGPLQQFLVLRLAERDGQQYAVRIRTMNEKRLRHLIAIANSF